MVLMYNYHISNHPRPLPNAPWNVTSSSLPHSFLSWYFQLNNPWLRIYHLTLLSLLFSLFLFQLREIIWILSFSLWLTSFDMMPCRSIQIPNLQDFNMYPDIALFFYPSVCHRMFQWFLYPGYCAKQMLWVFITEFLMWVESWDNGLGGWNSRVSVLTL